MRRFWNVTPSPYPWENENDQVRLPGKSLVRTWTSPPPNGIIFVDTPSGNPLSSNSPSSDLITVDIHGNWSQGWNGWLVVAGTIAISGNTTLSGLIYAQNDVDLHGAGGGSITGAVISTNRIDSQSTNVDTEDVGNAPISYNCRRVRDGGGFHPSELVREAGNVPRPRRNDMKRERPGESGPLV